MLEMLFTFARLWRHEVHAFAVTLVDVLRRFRLVVLPTGEAC